MFLRSCNGVSNLSVKPLIKETAFAGGEELRRQTMICPKPRRFGFLASSVADDSVRPLRWHLSNEADVVDSRSGPDVLDFILMKGGYDQCSSAQISSSPPYFCGSPPCRVSNPVIKDDRFGDEKLSPSSSLSSSSPSSRKGGSCVLRGNFGNKPAVRVEGFDCLNRDRRNCGIPALA